MVSTCSTARSRSRPRRACSSSRRPGPAASCDRSTKRAAGCRPISRCISSGAHEAWALAEHYAHALGSTRARVIRTTVREETEIDLFGEQSVLCGGMNALVSAAYNTLVDAGYTPEVAYLECVHQLKFLADLLHARGVAGLRRGISGTALYGDLTRGPGSSARRAARACARCSTRSRSGAFAREWLAEVEAGKPTLTRLLAAGDVDPFEEGRRRALGDGPSA
jgi:ketol-acid reductoisomerase